MRKDRVSRRRGESVEEESRDKDTTQVEESIPNGQARKSGRMNEADFLPRPCRVSNKPISLDLESGYIAVACLGRSAVQQH